MTTGNPTPPPAAEPQAERFKQSNARELFHLAVDIAGEVIGFDTHRIYLAFPDKSELLWCDPGAYADAAWLAAEKERSQKSAERLRDCEGPLAQLQEEEAGQWVALAQLRLGGQAHGYLAVARHHLGRFTSTEGYLLLMVARLLESALGQEEGADHLLRRLHLAFRDDRRLQMLHLSAGEVSTAYLLKALAVCHLSSPDVVVDPQEKRPADLWDGPVVRATVKTLADNTRSLRHAAFLSTNPEESSQDRSEDTDELPTGTERPETVAAVALVGRRTIATNNYPSWRGKKPPFPDSQCHISAPILAPRTPCRGVLSIETARVDAYRRCHAAALALLAAHLSVPLAQAREREASPVRAEPPGEAFFQRLRSDPTQQGLVAALGETLVQRGYDRVLVSEYVEATGEVRGLRQWPAPAGELALPRWRVQQGPQAPECLAVERRKVITEGGLAQGERQVEGWGGPFAVFPLLDSHGRPTWLVRAARRDQAAMGKADRQFNRDLARQVMKAREEEWKTRLERLWLEQMLRRPFRDQHEMLRWFADFLTENRLVVRCRVYTIEAGKQKQHPLHEGCGRVTPGFLSVELNDQDEDIFRSLKPVLFVRERGKTALKEGEEFGVKLNMPEAHEKELENARRSQWVEVPVWQGGELVAKLVLDHDGAPDDAFTVVEMRLISRFTRTLAMAADDVEAQRTHTQLCCLGLHASLLWHHLTGTVWRLRALSDSASDNLRQMIQAIATSLTRFDGVFRKGWETASPPPDVSVSEELRHAGEILRPQFDVEPYAGIGLEFPKDEFPQLVPGLDRPLLLILLSLVTNAADAINERREDAPGYVGRINIEVRQEAEALHLRVEDNGIGMDAEHETELRERLRNPDRFLPRHERSKGLVFSAMLARENGWAVELVQTANPTVFEVIIPSGSRKG